MALVTLPPFERFYADHREAVFGRVSRLLRRSDAEDAYQETFLRALRAYPTLRHAERLDAWVLTIATRVAIDVLRRRSSDGELPDLPAPETARPAFAQIEHLTAELPPKERAAVVLRYGYDLDYADIGAALGSSEEAARQAASSGVRRLRGRRSE